MERKEWLKWRDYWHKENLKSEEGRNKWRIAQSIGLESSICSVQGCLRDAIGFMWADEEDIQALKNRPGLIDKNKKRAEELKDELQKCIFHTDKENEIWIENWDGEMEKWKRERDEEIIKLKSKILFSQEENLNRILENRPRDYEWRSERVREFWRRIRNYRDVEFNPNSNDQNGRWGITQGGTYNFSFFIFPEFEERNIKRNENGDLIVRRDFSFWGEGEIYRFTRNADFREATFTQNADFSWATFTQYADFREATFTRNAYFIGTTFTQYADFREATFTQNADFSGATFTQHGIFENININNPEPGNLTLSRIDLSSDTSQIILRNVRLGGLTISFINRRLTPDNFLIHNLDISDPDGTIHFESVYLEDLKFVNVNWGDVSTRRICPDLYDRDPRAARDIYRQIKLALDKQENYIDARKFYALELQAYGRELEIELRNTILETGLGKFIRRVSNFLSEKLHTNAEAIENTFYSHVIPYLYGLITILGFLLIPSIISVPHHLLTGFKEVIGKSVELWQAHQLNVQNLGDIPIFSVINPIISATILLVVMWLNIWIHLHLRRLTGSLSRNPLADILIYRLYGLTADFGLSWIRPLIGLFITFGVYYLLYTINFGIHYRLGPLSILLEPYNSIASIFPLLNGLTANGNISPFSALILYTLIAYFIYQTVLALRRRVRR